MRGYLKIVVLEELSKEEMTGYALMNAIEHSIGKRPSSGSIYPLLSSLKEKGLIKERKRGTKKWYTTTKQGRDTLATYLAERQKLIQHHMKLDEVFSDITDEKVKQPQCFKAPFVRNFDLLKQFKTRLIDVIESKDFEKKEAAFRRIMRRTIKELRDL